MDVHIGAAGWSIPRAVAARFPTVGSTLQRYAARLNAAEINTTFYRSHRPETYDRWLSSTPPDFRFAVKAPKAVTHVARLVDADKAMDAFMDETSRLGAKRGPVLVQLPPSLAFDQAVAERFFGGVRTGYAGELVCEPRHASWFENAAETLFQVMRIGRVAADPVSNPAAAQPGGWPGIAYWRLHGAPRMYFSPYDDDTLAGLAASLRAAPPGAWCIFDNTASGAAADDAMRLQAMCAGDGAQPSAGRRLSSDGGDLWTD